MNKEYRATLLLTKKAERRVASLVKEAALTFPNLDGEKKCEDMKALRKFEYLWIPDYNGR